MKKLSFLLVMAVLMLSSCASSYCPAYADNVETNHSIVASTAIVPNEIVDSTTVLTYVECPSINNSN